jgi:hypothetical protein
MNTMENKRLIQRWMAFADAGFPGPFDEFIAADYVGHLGGATMDRANSNGLNGRLSAHSLMRDIPSRRCLPRVTAWSCA